METKINQAIKSVLDKYGDKYFFNGTVNKQKLIQDIGSYEKDLIKNLLLDNVIKANFTIEFEKTTVFNVNKMIELIEVNEFYNDSYTRYSKKIGLTNDGKFIDETTEVVLDFPYKDTILKGGMTKEDLSEEDLKPDEPFLNEVIAKEEIDVMLDDKILVNVKKHDINGNNDGNIMCEKDNLIIKGNNLLVLHSLRSRFSNKVKLIYVDPPYNTGKDSFKYNDKFSRSTWLTFMKNRLEASYDLLRDDGAIFISIDEKQQAYLQVLMNDIFGENNLLEVFHIQARFTQKSLNEKDDFQPVMEYVLAYAKNKELFRPNKPYDNYDLSKFKWEIEERSSGEEIELGGKKVKIFKKGEYKIKKLDDISLDGLKDTWASGSVLTGNTSGKFFDNHLSGRKSIDGLEVLYKVEGIGEDGLGYRYFTGPKKESSIRGQFYSGIPLERLDQIKMVKQGNTVLL